MTGRMPEPCAAMLYPATRDEPAEYCDEDALPGSEFCQDHQDPDVDTYERDDLAAWPDEHSPNL